MKTLLKIGIIGFAISFSSLAICAEAPGEGTVTKPSDKFDLSFWKITLPQDDNRDGKPDEVDVRKMKGYAHPDYFFLDDKGHMVFQAPNKATTSANSSNTRSELRQMIRGKKKNIKTHGRKNNFAIKAHPAAKKFGSIGGKLSATLRVNHTSTRAKYPDKPPAHSVVVGQIHAGKDKKLVERSHYFGFGNEPLKIYYKKWPDHKYGSVFWTYERNLAKKNPNRRDIAYPVWGNTWESKDDPLEKGVELGEDFSYVVEVKGNVMYLTFSNERLETVTYDIDLSNNVDAYGKVDSKDSQGGYIGDWMYFKAGAYNQCSTKDDEGFWYTACLGTGDWKTDYANGDYTSVSFVKLELD